MVGGTWPDENITGGTMATYEEIRSLFQEISLRNKVEVAVCEAARIIAAVEDTTDSPWDQAAGAHDLRVKWAAKAIQSTASEANRVYKYVLAANKSATISQILGASDSAIQGNVNEVVDLLAKGDDLAGV